MSAPLTVPSEFGRYYVQQAIGEGGMGSVYLALDRQLHRRVALKVPHFKSKEPRIVIDRFYREARVAARIEHPNICRVYDVGECDGHHYLTMEYIEGTALSKMLSPEHPWPLFNAAGLVRKIALAVQVLHENGVIHRDLKPSNILLRPSGEPVLMDFGLARSMAKDSERITSTGEFMGTPAYMSPEQANADATVELGAATDIYSLGVILYEMVTGQLPFKGSTTQILVQLVTEFAKPPSDVRRELPAAFDLLCVKALSKRPEMRFASALEFADALGPFLAPAAIPVKGPATVASGGTIDATPPFIPMTQAPHMPLAMGATLHTGVGSEAATISGVQRLVPPPLPSATTIPPARPRGVPLLVGFGSVALMLALVWTWSLWMKADGSQETTSADTEQTGDLIAALGSKVPPQADPWGREVVNSVNMKLVRIGKGKFEMGSPGDEPGRHGDEAAHPVEITQDFYLGVHEVTQMQYYAVMGRNPANFHRVPYGGPDFPVECVTWDEAMQFCDKLTALPGEVGVGRRYRLPTEAEWEYACRAGSQKAWSVEGDAPLSSYAWFKENSDGHTHRTGTRRANAWGLHDMHGNVWEWTSDFYKDDVKPLGAVDPHNTAFGEGRVLRGGSWNSSAAACRSARRLNDAGAVRDIYIGFRVVAVRAH